MLTRVYGELLYADAARRSKAIKYADSAIAIAYKLPNKVNIIRLYYRLGIAHHGLGEFIEALNYYDRGIAECELANDLNFKAGILLNKSAIYTNLSDYIKAIEVSQSAIDIYTRMNDQGGLASIYNNLAAIYIDLKDFKTAYAYAQKALLIFESQSVKSRGVASIKVIMGNILLEGGTEDIRSFGIKPDERFTKAIQLFESAYAIAALEADDNLKGDVLIGIGHAYEKSNYPRAAAEAYSRAVNEGSKGPDKNQVSINYIKAGDFFIRQNELIQGLDYLNKGLVLAERASLMEPQKSAYQSLSVLYEKKGRFDSALIYFRKYEAVKEIIFNKDKEKEITRKKMALDFSIKEQEYTFQQQIADKKLNEQLLLARQKQQIIELQKQKQEIIEKENNLQRLAFLTKQAQLELQQNQQAAQLQEERLKFGYDKKISAGKISLQQAEITLKNRVGVLLGLLAFIIFMAGLQVFLSRRKTIELNKTIEAQKRSLEELVQVKDKVFSVVGHDMRAPINSLMSFVQLLEFGDLSKEQLAKYAAELGNNLRFTSSLMENLLYWAGSQMQGFKARLEWLNVQELGAKVLQNLEASAQQKNIRIFNQLPSSAKVWADQEMLTLILRNLVSNAIKFSYPDTEVFIRLQETADGNILSVTDSGTGLSEAKLAEINGDTATAIDSSYGTKREKGTGLGLLLSKTFIAMMQGKISASNNPDKGSMFSIFLPFKNG